MKLRSGVLWFLVAAVLWTAAWASAVAARGRPDADAATRRHVVTFSGMGKGGQRTARGPVEVKQSMGTVELLFDDAETGARRRIGGVMCYEISEEIEP